MFTATVGIPLLSCYSHIGRGHSVFSQQLQCRNGNEKLKSHALPTVQHIGHRTNKTDQIVKLNTNKIEIVQEKSIYK